jgi:hypothetical protein
LLLTFDDTSATPGWHIRDTSATPCLTPRDARRCAILQRKSSPFGKTKSKRIHPEKLFSFSKTESDFILPTNSFPFVVDFR